MLYSDATLFVYVGATTDFAQHMHCGSCVVVVIHQKQINQLHSSEIHTIDCASQESGSLLAQEASCGVDQLGRERDDCSIR